MKINILENEKEKGGDVLKFNVSEISVSLANTLRRIIISEIPTMAIDKIVFKENSSILNDEFLAHRFGLVPLTTDLKNYTFADDCSCELTGCKKCNTKLTLDFSGPGTVHSKDLKSSNPKIAPVYKDIPIVKLTEKQNVKLEAIAVLGTGKDHIKWQSGLCSYEIKDNGSFDFVVESYGQLTTKEMLERAFLIFEEKISKVKKLKL